MLQHSWSVQAVHCFYYSAFSSQHRSLHWNTTWHLAKHRHPLILSQPTLFRYSKYITVYFLRGKPAIYWGAGGNRKKKNAIPQDWTHGSWILVHVNSEATLGSQTPPHKAQVWNLQISAQFLFLFFPSLMQKGVMENCDRPCHKAFSDILPQSRPFKFRLQQHKLGYSLPKTAVLCNFPYEEGVSWSHALSWAIGLINTAHLWKNTRTKWGKTGTANYCYLVSTCINSFSDSVLFAKSI